MTIARFARGVNGRRRPRRTLMLAGALLLLAAAPARAADWLDPADLSKPGRDAFNPVVASDAAGDTMAIWERQSTLNPSINLQLSTRSPGETFTAPVDLALRATEPDLAMTPGGEAVAVWKHFEIVAGHYVLEAATRPPGGSFSAPETIYSAAPALPSDPIVNPQELELALGPNGTVLVTWSETDPKSGYDKIVCEKNPEPPFNDINCPNPSFVMASVRHPGGVFSTPVRVSPAWKKWPAPPPGETPTQKEEREKEELEYKKAESKRFAVRARGAVDPAGNAVVVFSYFDNEDLIVQSAAHAAGGGGFSAPSQVSSSGEDSAEPTVGMDSAGNAIATWYQTAAGDRVIQGALRPPGGSFSALPTISATGGLTDSPEIAVNSDGTATVVWRYSGPSESYVQTATRPPGGTFGAPVSLSSGKDAPQFPEIAMNDAGSAVIAWSGNNTATTKITRAAIRPAGGEFGPPSLISLNSPDPFHPFVSMDSAGDATAVWTRTNGIHDIVQMAGYDAVPPSLRNVSIPTLGRVGQPVAFTASSADEWPIGQPHFSFGDGVAADGGSVSHTYSKPGSYTVRVTATDGVGTPTSTTGSILIKARNEFSLGKLARIRRKGIATLLVNIVEPGSVTASGKGLKKTTVRSAKGGTVKLTLKAAGKGLRTLNETGKLKAKLKVVYSPDGGDRNTASRRVKLLKTLD